MLEPWFLGSLFNRLVKRGRNIAGLVGRHDVICYAEVNFLKRFLWERFASLAPVPWEFDSIPLKKVQRVNKVQMSLLKVRGTRWLGLLRLEAPRRLPEDDRHRREF